MTSPQKQWVQDYVNGTISAEDFEAFEEALLADPAYRAATRSFLVMDSHLRQGEESVGPLLELWVEPTAKGKAAPLVILPWMVMVAALLALLVAGVVGILGPGSAPSSPTASASNAPQGNGIALLTHASETVWQKNSSINEGTILPPGILSLLSGTAEIELFTGTRILIEGPTKLELVSLDHVICQSGKLRAVVPPPARGFRVTSEQFELVDLGTEFGVEVDPAGSSEIHVFDGEVEILPVSSEADAAPAEKTTIFAGGGLSLAVGTAPCARASAPENFPSFDALPSQRATTSGNRVKSWQEWHTASQDHPDLLVFYDFDGSGGTLTDLSAGKHHGTIVGTEWTTGRWPGKKALEFKRPSDRVRIQVPGTHDALSLLTWIRVDALPNHNQGILLPDSYADGRPHWILEPNGHVYFGVSYPDFDKNGRGYTAPQLFTPNLLGTWVCYAWTYDRTTASVAQYLDGEEVYRGNLAYDQPLEIGAAAIGNWGLPPMHLKTLTEERGVQHLIGRMDELSIWSTALSPEEIRAIYLATRP